MGHIEWQCDDVTVDDGDVMGHIEWQYHVPFPKFYLYGDTLIVLRLLHHK